MNEIQPGGICCKDLKNKSHVSKKKKKKKNLLLPVRRSRFHKAGVKLEACQGSQDDPP